MRILAQRDPRWASVHLGLSDLRISGYGCTTCGIAEINNDFGQNCTPDQVAEHVDWYTADGLVLWAKLNLKSAVFEPMGRVYTYDKARIDASVKDVKNKRVLLRVNLLHGYHWLKATQYNSKGRLMAHDPWVGDECDVVARYGAITGSAHFARRVPPLK